MLTEVMEYYGLERSPVDVEFFETDHHAQISRDLRTAIMRGRLIALTAVIGSGKTVLLTNLIFSVRNQIFLSIKLQTSQN